MTTGLREQLLAIREEHGYLDPKLLVDVARDRNHPLHSRFEWDNKVAGEAWRHEQAHRLIQSVRIKYSDGEDRPKDVRAFVAVPRDGAHQPTYEPTEEAMRDDFTRKIVLQQMEREWRSLKARYGDLAEFADMIRTSLDGAAA